MATARERAEEIASDLRILSAVLEKAALSSQGARDLAQATWSMATKRGRYVDIELSVGNFDLAIDVSGKFIPTGIAVSNRLYADFSFAQTLRDDDAEPIANIQKCGLQFRIRGQFKNKELIACWHFDLHDFPHAANSPCHPRFHIQFGGWGLSSVATSVAGVIIPDRPRFFSPPLDPILGVDFLLSHFNGPKWNDVRNGEPRYHQLVRRAQSRLWKPYFDEITDHLLPVAAGTPMRDMRLIPNLV